MNKQINKNIKNILFKSGDLKTKQSVFIIYDNTTIKISNLFQNYLKSLQIKFDVSFQKVTKYHGKELSKSCFELAKKHDLIISLTKYSIAHTSFRLKLSKLNKNFLSLPFYDMSLLSHKSLDVNFRKLTPLAKKISNLLEKSKFINILSKNGTCFSFKVNGAKSNCCPGWVYKGNIASPPDAEVNIPILGNYSNGQLVIDGSVTHELIGKLNSPIVINFCNGKIVSIKGKKSLQLKKILSNRLKQIMPAEFGIGLNKKCQLSGNMLMDEGKYGSIHIGIGSNSTIGGDKKIKFHLDFVLIDPIVYTDDKILIKNNKIYV